MVSFHTCSSLLYSSQHHFSPCTALFPCITLNKELLFRLVVLHPVLWHVSKGRESSMLLRHQPWSLVLVTQFWTEPRWAGTDAFASGTVLKGSVLFPSLKKSFTNTDQQTFIEDLLWPKMNKGWFKHVSASTLFRTNVQKNPRDNRHFLIREIRPKERRPIIRGVSSFSSFLCSTQNHHLNGKLRTDLVRRELNPKMGKEIVASTWIL